MECRQHKLTDEDCKEQNVIECSNLLGIYAPKLTSWHVCLKTYKVSDAIQTQSIRAENRWK